MSQAGIMVGSHGAGMTNSIFLPPGSAVIEIFAYKWWPNMYRSLAAASKPIHFRSLSTNKICSLDLFHTHIPTFLFLFFFIIKPGTPTSVFTVGMCRGRLQTTIFSNHIALALLLEASTRGRAPTLSRACPSSSISACSSKPLLLRSNTLVLMQLSATSDAFFFFFFFSCRLPLFLWFVCTTPLLLSLCLSIFLLPLKCQTKNTRVFILFNMLFVCSHSPLFLFIFIPRFNLTSC